MMFGADTRLTGGHVRLEMLAKDEDSGRSGCPSVYIDENGWAVIQGPEIEPTTRPGLATPLSGETRIRISPKVLVAAAEALNKRRSHEEIAEGPGIPPSGESARPPVFLDSDGYAVVQGPEVDSETRSSLVNLLPGETGVRISTEILTAAAAALQGR
jgi:hypothetical protein